MSFSKSSLIGLSKECIPGGGESPLFKVNKASQPASDKNNNYLQILKLNNYARPEAKWSKDVQLSKVQLGVIEVFGKFWVGGTCGWEKIY